MAFVILWKGKPIERFKTRAEASTHIGLVSTQMEFAGYTPAELRRFWKIKEVKDKRGKKRRSKKHSRRFC